MWKSAKSNRGDLGISYVNIVALEQIPAAKTVERRICDNNLEVGLQFVYKYPVKEFSNLDSANENN